MVQRANFEPTSEIWILVTWSIFNVGINEHLWHILQVHLNNNCLESVENYFHFLFFFFVSFLSSLFSFRFGGPSPPPPSSILRLHVVLLDVDNVSTTPQQICSLLTHFLTLFFF